MSIVRSLDSSIESIPDSVQAAKQAIQESELISEYTGQNERNPFIRKIFPDPRESEVIKGEVKIIKFNLESKLRILTDAREAQIQSLTERLNEYLMREKTKVRAETMTLFLQKCSELQTVTDQILNEFTNEMDAKLHDVKSISDPKLRKMRGEQLYRDFDKLMAIQEEVISRFQKIIFERV
jgi:hypothetical protein